jgi:cytoskeletal protein RodZ
LTLFCYLVVSVSCRLLSGHFFVITGLVEARVGSLTFLSVDSLVPVLGLLFNFTSIVGAALWAADMENKEGEKHPDEEPPPVQDSKSPPGPKPSPPQGIQSAANNAANTATNTASNAANTATNTAGNAADAATNVASNVTGQGKKDKESPVESVAEAAGKATKGLNVSTGGLGGGGGMSKKEA